MQNPEPIEILLVEDNPGDVELTQEAFLESKVQNRVHVARDGDEALDFLYARGKFAGAPRPDVILLDLNMPRRNGQEVLAIIKNDENMKHIPIVILTSSEAERDILESYRLHANSYIVKPVNLEKFLTVVREVEHFWISVVKLPGRRSMAA